MWTQSWGTDIVGGYSTDKSLPLKLEEIRDYRLSTTRTSVNRVKSTLFANLQYNLLKICTSIMPLFMLYLFKLLSTITLHMILSVPQNTSMPYFICIILLRTYNILWVNTDDIKEICLLQLNRSLKYTTIAMIIHT